MNYRHAFHAGNFADVLKHAALARVLTHLTTKETAFRVVDTHAGAGRYDLGGAEAGRTGEWRKGIGRVLSAAPPGPVLELLRPYLDCVRSVRGENEPGFYPGSPLVALALSRPQDRLVFCELHPDEKQSLVTAAARDSRASVLEIDGWTALKAQLPPPERRGVVLIDPPFEEPGEWRRLEDGLQEAFRRWATGIFMFWYPVKDPLETGAAIRRIARLGIPKILQAELSIATPSSENLVSSGILLINPHWKLADELKLLLPWLARTLGEDGTGKYRLGWLTGEHA